MALDYMSVIEYFAGEDKVALKIICKELEDVFNKLNKTKKQLISRTPFPLSISRQEIVRNWYETY